ncbi:MAG: succinylglutamate desuccinylase/aspartoacylase family protein [Pyrinomonadaceae bacterium]
MYEPAAGLRLPLLICRGVSPGRRLVAVAGIHGDEYEGMQAVWKAFRALDPAMMRGDFIGIPVAHVAAYEAATRESPLDRKNLARSFPAT